MLIDTFKNIFQSAARRKGGDKKLESLLKGEGRGDGGESGNTKSRTQLRAIPDDRYLAEMTKCIFRSGFVWKIIENKWSGFETAFNSFDTMSCAMLSDENLESLAQDARIVRNAIKIRTVRDNGEFIQRVRKDHQRFSYWIADWPVSDTVGLWAALKQGGSRMGGNTSSYFLRFIGKDGFILSRDVLAALRREGIIEHNRVPGKKALGQIQSAFNIWQADSGRSLKEISRTLAYSVES